MKHLIFLSMKYIRRKPLRTLLTWLCVVLSVFVLCTFGAFGNSLFVSVLNMEKETYGSWEANLSRCVEDADNKRKIVKQIADHAVVDDYFAYSSDSARFPLDRQEFDGYMCFFEFSDGTNIRRFNRITHYSAQGNSDLIPVEGDTIVNRTNGLENGCLVPSYFEDMGYKVGDVVKFTLTPIYGEPDESSEIIKNIRAGLTKKNGIPWVKDDPEFSTLSTEDKEKAEKSVLAAVLTSSGYKFEDFPLKNVERGESRQFAVRIAGFDYNSSSLVLSIFEKSLMSDMFGEFLSANGIFPENEYGTFVRIADSVDFDDGIAMLTKDLGYNPLDPPYNLNTDLLALELRSADAIASLVPFAGIAACILILIWALSRFIIDNAFEISAAERSSQFAALRVMGASKGQLLAIVLTEAVFYSLTAIPVGCAAAYLLCSTSMAAFRRLGMKWFTFSAHPAIAAGLIFLCLLAIFVSSYTSSMYGARKLSPAEALNFGKPKSKRRLKKEAKAAAKAAKMSDKKKHGRKSKLRLRSGRFIRRYTIKNIGRSKSRFIISTITMTIGVMLFTLSVITGIYSALLFKNADPRSQDDMMRYDYIMDSSNGASAVKAYDFFSKCDAIDTVKVHSGGMGIRANQLDTDMDKLNALYDMMPYDTLPSERKSVYFGFIDRSTYEAEFGDLTDMTYDEFVKSGSGIFCYDTHGPETVYNNKTRQFEGVCERMYKELDEPVEVRFSSIVLNSLTIGAVAVTDHEYCEVVLPIDSKLLLESEYIYTTIFLTFNEKSGYDAAKEAIDEYEVMFPQEFRIDSYIFHTGRKKLIGAVVRIAAAVILSIWLVGVLSMVNSVNTGILNRSRELMMLRSVGMNRKQLRNTVILESLLFSSLSSVLGNLLAFLTAIAAFNLNRDMLTASVAAIVVSIVLNVIISVIGAVPGIRSLSKVEAIAKTE